MKNAIFLFSFLAIAVTSWSQELYLNEVDDFTGESKKATRREVVGDNNESGYKKISVSVSAIRLGDTHAFRLKSSSDLGCAGAHDNYAMLKFSDDAIIKLEDASDIDCEDMAESTFIVNDELMARIEAKDAPVMIRFKQADYYTDAKTVNAEVWNAHWAAVAK